MAAAMSTPSAIAKKARQKFMPRRKATIEPVQAPVTGRGMPTKSASPQNSALSKFLPRRLERSKIHLRMLSKSLTLLASLEMGPKRRSRIGMGRMLPAIDTPRTSGQES